MKRKETLTSMCTCKNIFCDPACALLEQVSIWRWVCRDPGYRANLTVRLWQGLRLLPPFCFSQLLSVSQAVSLITSPPSPHSRGFDYTLRACAQRAWPKVASNRLWSQTLPRTLIIYHLQGYVLLEREPFILQLIKPTNHTGPLLLHTGLPHPLIKDVLSESF